LVKLPPGALMFPSPAPPGESFSFTKLRNPRNTTKEFVRKAAGLVSKGCGCTISAGRMKPCCSTRGAGARRSGAVWP
jgi:hypothetical protein